MTPRFDVEFLPEAVHFMETMDPKARQKIYFNIRKVQVRNDPELFKKLNDTIWEFRTLYQKTHYRLFAFWEKRDGEAILVIATNGIIKKTGKTPPQALEKAMRIRKQYLNQQM